MVYTDRKIIFISHSPSKNTKILSDTVLNVIRGKKFKTKLEIYSPFNITANEVKNSNGVIIGTLENFGYMAGATKDFFDRCYNELLDDTQGLPVFYYIRAGLDGEGSERAMNRILKGLRWKQVLEPLILKGSWDNKFIRTLSDASLNFIIGVDEGIY